MLVDGNVLVTGASGLVGRALVAALSAGGEEPWTTSRSPSPRANHICADLADAAKARHVLERSRPSAVIHLAGGAAKDADELWRSNVTTTVTLLDAVVRSRTRPRVVIVGSAAEYGEAHSPLDESALRRPVTAYGKAKAYAVDRARAISARAGIPLVVVRPFNIVSDQQPVGTPLGDLRSQLLAGSGPRRTVVCGRLDVVRDFVPLGFVVDALLAVAATDRSGTYNVCSGVGIRLGTVLDAMAELLGVTIDIREDPRLVALAAPDCVVGDPAKLASLGLAIAPTPAFLAEQCLGVSGRIHLSNG